MLKSLLSTFTHTQNAPGVVKKITNKFHQGVLTIIFFWLVLKLENVCTTFSSFRSYLSLPPVATNDRTQLQCLNILFNNKTGPLF